ncbi:hypothetical protein StoSoilB3_42750 (plasmid) [Arthrobacter sp. StoSoilB3]|nr:hypothetical protein StoSoilB3_42750 [Arthrobacter sp. StoSoilB3]
MISDENGIPNTQLLPLEKYLLRDGENSQAVLTWLRRSPMARVAKAMATGQTPISLHAIASLPLSRATGYFAALLMEAGVVPTENFDRIRLEVWEKDFFETISQPEVRSVLQRYAAWYVNPRFSNQAHLSRTDESLRFRQSKAHLTAVAEWLLYLDTANMDLGNVPHRIFDDYVATHGLRGDTLTSFVRWARTQGLTRLRSDYRPRSSPGSTAVPDKERWDWVKMLLDGEDTQTASRVGGLLVLVYGISATRVVSIRRRDVTIAGNTTRISLGKDPIELPDAIGSLVRRLVAATEISATSDSIWLMPGRRPGRHLTTTAMSAPLRRQGINLRAGRSAALINLARDVPPSVLSDLLGISITTATRWSTLSSRDWIDYPKTRLPGVTESG